MNERRLIGLASDLERADRPFEIVVTECQQSTLDVYTRATGAKNHRSIVTTILN